MLSAVQYSIADLITTGIYSISCGNSLNILYSAINLSTYALYSTAKNNMFLQHVSAIIQDLYA